MRNKTRIKNIEGETFTRLPPGERLEMLLTAGARREDETVRRLMDTCPRGTYEMINTDFFNQISRARVVANMGVITAEKAHFALRMVELFQEDVSELEPVPKLTIIPHALLREQRGYILLDFKANWSVFETLARDNCGVTGLELLSGLPTGGWRLPDEYLAKIRELVEEELPKKHWDLVEKSKKSQLEVIRAECPDLL